jgi:AcrR family transcriptional regulator
VTAADAPSTSRRSELLELAYAHALGHGLVGMSLRPLAEAIGSSPGVLLYCFGSKDELVRALLARARQDELALLGPADGRPGGIAEAAERTWQWLAAPEHRGLLTLWAEAYGQSLVEPDGPWGGFARRTVDDWLEVLAAAQPPRHRRTRAGARERTLVLALLRGSLLDLLATGDRERTGAAVAAGIAAVRTG